MGNRETYGIDAPVIVGALTGGGLVLLALRLIPAAVPGALIAHKLWLTGISMLASSAWMMASSLWIKRRVMRSLLRQRYWRGDETVLDIGCGRGLLAVEAARLVPMGRVFAVDLWQATDLSGNTPKAILENATIAGVESRLTIDTGDARKLPYADASFDVVASMTALHNIPNKEGRRKAILEAWRVLRPGGQVLIFDIRHVRTYLEHLRDCGAIQPVLAGPIVLWGPLGWRLSVKKPLESQVRPDEPAARNERRGPQSTPLSSRGS